jgi:hypothetical protein
MAKVKSSTATAHFFIDVAPFENFHQYCKHYLQLRYNASRFGLITRKTKLGGTLYAARLALKGGAFVIQVNVLTSALLRLTATRKYAAANRQKRREYDRVYAATHLEENAEKMKRWRRANPISRMLKGASDRAKAAGFPFDLTPNDINIPSVCPVFGFELRINLGRAGYNSPALDRIIPSRGYVRGNVQVISHKANMLKSNATAEELFQIAQYALRNRSPLS